LGQKSLQVSACHPGPEHPTPNLQHRTARLSGKWHRPQSLGAHRRRRAL